MAELNRCPYCHGSMKIDYKFNPLRYAVVHKSNFSITDRCWGGTDYKYKSEQEATDAWNKYQKK